MSARRDRSPAFGRRALLRAAGATLLVPRFLRTAFAAEDELPPRLVLAMQANGVHPATFWPGPTGPFSSPSLEPLLGEARLAARTTVVKGVQLHMAAEQRRGNQHDQGFSSFWTGVGQVGTPSDGWGGGPSIDQQLKRQLGGALGRVPHATLNCGVLACAVSPKNGHRTSFSYVGPKQQVPTEIDPVKLFATLFDDAAAPVGVDAAARAARRLRQRRSLLDHVAGDLGALERRLGPVERRKLELHTTGLRELERRLGAALVAPPPGAACGPDARPEAAAHPLDPTLEANVPRLAALMTELVAQATICNVTRVVTLMLGHSGNQWRYGWLDPPLDKDSHEAIAHQDHSGNLEAARGMTQMTRWVAGQVAGIARRWAEVPDGEGTVLDRSLLVWTNENAHGNHGLDDLPIVLVGGAAGRLRATGRLVDVAARGTDAAGRPRASYKPHHQVGTTVLNLMGVAADGFGDEPRCGPLAGLV